MWFHKPTWTVSMPCRWVHKHDERGWAIELKEVGWSNFTIAQHSGHDIAIILWYWQEWVSHGFTKCQEDSAQQQAMTEWRTEWLFDP